MWLSMKEEYNKRRILFDIILVSFLLVVAVIALFVFKNFNTGAADSPSDEAFVVIRWENEVLAVLPLSRDATITVGEGGTNTVVISDGCVRMLRSTCPGYQDCVMHEQISLVGKKIICLPNRISVAIEENAP